MKKFKKRNINTPRYWDKNQTAMDFGLRQQKYAKLSGKCKSICELGCGLSPFLYEMNKKGIKCTGVDFSPQTILNASFLFPKVKYILSDVTSTPIKDKSIDVVVAGEVIEHLPDPQKLIDEMVRVAKSRLVISTPILEFDEPEHLWEFSPDDLRELLSPYGKVKTEVVKSTRFPGRKYIFATCEL